MIAVSLRDKEVGSERRKVKAAISRERFRFAPGNAALLMTGEAAGV
jgi:hypothetical protein